MKTHDVKKLNRRPFVALGVGAVALATGLGWQAANGGPAKTEIAPTDASTNVPASSSAAVSSNYQPSQLSGLEVRHVPKSQKSKSNAGWIYVKPGTTWSAARAAAAQRSVSRGIIDHVEDGRSKAGGKVLYLNQSQLAMEVAHRDGKGKVQWECDEESHPHSLAEHKAHQAKAAKSSSVR